MTGLRSRMLAVAGGCLLVVGALLVFLAFRHTSARPPAPPKTVAATTKPPASRGPDEDDSPRVTLPAQGTAWSPAEAARHAVGLVEAALAEAIRDAKRFPELSECLQSQPRAACAAFEHEAIRKSISWPVGPRLAAGRQLPIRDLIARHGADALASEGRRAAEEVLVSDAGATRRAAALALEERFASEAKEPAPPYDDAVYEGLAGRSATEVYYLTRTLEQQPSSSKAVADELSKLALDYKVAPDLRRQAIRSLGASGDGPLLESVVDQMLGASLLSDDALAKAVGPALARCGESCNGYLDRLAESKSSSARLAALMAASRASIDVRQRLVAKLTPHATSAAERDQLRWLVGNASARRP